MAEEKKNYYEIDKIGKLTCRKCKVPLVKANATFAYLDNAFPVELPVCPKCGFVYVPEELALGKVLSVERALEDK
jgi:RNase P subunit RPR2